MGRISAKNKGPKSEESEDLVFFEVFPTSWAYFFMKLKTLLDLIYIFHPPKAHQKLN